MVCMRTDPQRLHYYGMAAETVDERWVGDAPQMPPGPQSFRSACSGPVE